MPRSMPGHGFLMTRNPPSGGFAGLAFFVVDVGVDAGEGQRRGARLGFVAAGSGVIMMPPVSVCHQVSTIGQRRPPITRWYHIQASGLMGSPTVPSTRSDDRSCFLGCSSPKAHEGSDRGRRGVEDRSPGGVR